MLYTVIPAGAVILNAAVALRPTVLFSGAYNSSPGPLYGHAATATSGALALQLKPSLGSRALVPQIESGNVPAVAVAAPRSAAIVTIANGTTSRRVIVACLTILLGADHHDSGRLWPSKLVGTKAV